MKPRFHAHGIESRTAPSVGARRLDDAGKAMKKNGSVLMLVMLFTLVLTLIGFAVIYIFGMEEIASRTEIVNARVLYLADSGIELAKAWMINIVKFPEVVNVNYKLPFDPFETSPKTITFSDGVVGHIYVWIIPDPNNDINYGGGYGNNGHYVIVSSGTITVGASPGPVYETIKCVSERVYISTTTSLSNLEYKVIPNTWNEKPTQRIYN